MPVSQSEPQPLNYYKRLEGTIAGKQVIMHLQKQEDSYRGVYYYRHTGGWIILSPESMVADSIVFTEYSEANSVNMENEAGQGQIRCKLENDHLTGEWISADKKKVFPVDLKESYPEGTYRFSIENYGDSLVGYSGRTGSPSAYISYSFVTSKENEWLNTQVKKIILYDSSLTFKAGFTKLRDIYFEDYKEELPKDYDSLEMYSSFNYSQSQNVYVRYNENNFVILESSEYIYSGGAHGNYGSSFYCFDVAAKRQLHLTDIISADSITLQQLVEKYFRIQYNEKLDSLSEVLFVNNLPANDNFYFNEKGISFLYNPYEVASYAQGEISVFIPFSALNNFIQPDFRKRMF